MDGPARDGLVAAVRLLAARGTSVVVATHDSELAAAVADRVLVVADGEVHDRGAPKSALTGPGNEFATQLGRLFAVAGSGDGRRGGGSCSDESMPQRRCRDEARRDLRRRALRSSSGPSPAWAHQAPRRRRQ